AILFLIPSSSFGQLKKFAVGYEKGLSLVSMHGNLILDELQKTKLSFTIGVFFQYNINANLALRTNLSFERKGFSFGKRAGHDSIGNPATIKSHVRFDYLCLPLLARASFGKKYRFFINAGPYIGYLIGQADVTQTNNDPKVIRKNIAYFDKADLGLSGGAGVEIPLKRYVLSFEIRDNFGLSNISKLPVINNGTIKTNALNLLIAAHKR
ncbi:MAG TPA: porin family protein, partial [Chitinophagaceae bacterium]|nr:porin family protein [Chitinophagaceae bacterium]